ncbi:uncharacterized protein LOC119723754 [Patiria miniata]|uniref:Uncharacterized protein n=1 Tax=Patiria miniata TaxID=46514 RepID=A0A913ZFF6_PATMI|nr:uncharacterized protein LOC119723754 [Patiria miniata]
MRGKRRRSVKSQSAESIPGVTEIAETSSESQPDQAMQDLGDEGGMSQLEDATNLEGLDGGDYSEEHAKEEPQEVTDEERGGSSQEQLGEEAGSDVREGVSEDADGRGNREEETTSSVDLEDVSKIMEKAELEKLFDPKWAQLINKLPELCDPGLVLEENTHKEGNTKMQYQVPMMPIADCVKARWEDVNRELQESSQISPFRKLDDKRYWISDTDFKRYCQSSTVDREYCIQVEKELMRQEAASHGGPPRRRPYVKKSNAIRNPLLQSCENGFKKCDESARMAIRATSHTAFMLNALRNVLEKSPSTSQGDVISLLDGIQGSVESIADAASRVVARATVSRRDICMSQIHRNETESFEDFTTLPMDSKNLFHGEFYPTMQEHRKVNAPVMKRKLPPQPLDMDPNAKRPSLMDASFASQRPSFDYRDNYGGRFRPPPNQFRPWGGSYNEGYRSYNSGRGRGSHSRGNKRW